MKHHEHDCHKCEYLGSGTLEEVSYDFYACVGMTTVLVYRSGPEGNYGATDLLMVSPLNIPAMMAMGLYFKKMNARGAGDYIRIRMTDEVGGVIPW